MSIGSNVCKSRHQKNAYNSLNQQQSGHWITKGYLSIKKSRFEIKHFEERFMFLNYNQTDEWLSEISTALKCTLNNKSQAWLKLSSFEFLSILRGNQEIGECQKYHYQTEHLSKSLRKNFVHKKEL